MLGKNESVKDLSFTAQSSQSFDITGCCQGIDSGKCAENKFSKFNAKSQRFLSEENLTIQTNDSSIQRVVINSENPKPQLFSLTLPSNMRMNTRKTNNKCSPPVPSPDLKKSNMTHQKTKLTHEKFPSWPVASGGLESSTSPLPVTMASYRSNSWTDKTDYPKIRAVYTRPKKTFKISTNQLQPVQEKSGHGSKHTSNTEHYDIKIPLDSRMMYCKPTAATCLSLKESLNRNIPDNIKHFQNCPLHIPTCYGDKQYNVSSLPERDIPIDEAKDKPASSHNSKPYWNKYDNIVKDCIGYSVSESSAHECSLTSSSGLEKWNELYALNIPQPLENDTPFLDRLRLECQALSKTWPPPPGSDILETSSEAETLVGSTDSGSESSRDTLKWHGSYSDLSNLSTHMSNRSSLFDSGLSTMPDSGHLSPQSLYDGTTSTNHLETIERDNLTSKHELQQENIAHSSKVQPAERHDSESVLYYVPGSRQSIDETHKYVHISSSKEKNQNNYDISGISVAQRIKMLQQQIEERKPNKSLFSSSTSSVFPEEKPLVKRPNRNCKETKLLVSDVSHSGVSKTTVSHENTEEFCIIGQTQVGTNFPNYNVRSCFSEPHDRGHRIIYLDPEKKHRVSDPELKAIQKKAVMSFCQRQKKNSESQPAGQELSLCTAMALPVDHPMKQPTDQELCISTTTALVVEEPIKQPFGQKLRIKDTKVAALNNFRSNNVSEQHILSLPAKYKQGLDNYLSHSRSADLRILNSLKNERSEECDYVPEYRSFYNNHPGLLQTTDLLHGRSPEAIPQITSRIFNQHSLSVPNLAGIQLNTATNQNHHSIYNSQSSQEHLAVGLSKMFAHGNHTDLQTSQGLETKVPSNTVTSAIRGAQDSKEIAPLNRDPSDITYFRSYKSPRKAQVKEIHHSNETATVKVITPDGVTLVETDRSDTSRDDNKLQPPPRIPPRRVNKPPLQPHQRPTRPPPPPPPILEVENRRTRESDYAELYHPHKEAILCSSSCHVKKESDRRPLFRIEDASKCSSPELPLPPPPNTTDTEIINDGQPLPSPPHLQEEEPPTKGLPQSLIVYPKNSYMSYRSERKLGRQGFDGNYWRSSSTSGSLDLSYPVSKSSQDDQIRVSPASWEKLHNIRKQGTTLIFHSNSIRERTWSDSRCLVDRGSPSSSSDHKFPATPDQSFQLENISEDSQTRTTVSTNKDSSAGNDSQFQSANASHGSSSPLKKLILSHSLKQTDNQNSDSLISNHEVSFQYEPEVNIHCTKFLQEKLIENHNPILNGQYVGVPTLHYDEEKETMVDERFSEEEPHQSIIVQQNNTSNHHGQQINNESNKGLTVKRKSSATQTTDTPRLGRKYKTREEIECERLSKDFVNHCDDTILKNLLVPAPNHKTISDYMEGLFNLELERGGQPTRKTSSNQDEMVKQTASSCLSNMSGRERNELSHNSAYFTTSESKAKLLTGYIQEMGPEDWSLNNELSIKKEELIASIDRKLECLRLEHTVLREEMVQNEVLGKEVTSRVEQLVKPNEFEKYRLHIEELEKIINLLLSLSGRLARAQNALFCLSIEAGEEEKRVLQEKYDKLLGQHEEARRLKESIDKRSHQVSTFLHRYLSSEEYAEYDHFVKMKSKLLIDAREISEKIKLGAEQLAALQNNVNFQIWKQAQTKTQVLPGT
ncbi:uncharacterized protein LOC143251968 isoform X2 [Tachypleus tridentatus]|uniref:uncharacterized protein LOC143251968 isoform X2 n=1 Tax=Tachypleus tridentatus TaxID=6853 RepID=UPI003FD547EC